MQLSLISDTHGAHSQIKHIPKCDVLIHAGDFSGESGQAATRDFLTWFEGCGSMPKVLVAGNHNSQCVKWPGLFKAMVEELAPSVRYLGDSGCVIDGVKFWGSPYTSTFLNWYFMEDDGAAMDRHCDMVPDDTDVLVTHGPPYGYLDKANHGGHNLGSMSWRKCMERVKPKLMVFGHIHGGHGYTKLHHGCLINASLLDEDYRLTHPIQTYNLK